MRTDKIDIRTNFNGYYRIPNTSENIKYINEVILPGAEFVKFPIRVINGETPIASPIMERFARFSGNNGASIIWLKNHAKMHNIDLPIDNFDTLTIVTSQKDCMEFSKYSFKSLKKTAKNVIITGFKRMFGFKSKEYKKGEPAYLEDLRMYAEEYNKSKNEFKNYLADKKVKKFDNIFDLLDSLGDEIEKLYA